MAGCVAWTLGAVAVVLAAGCPSSPPKPKRIVLITADTLRFDSLDETHMPATARFARRGQIFASFYAASSATQPTHASLFTGRHPWQHGVDRNGAVLASEQATIAEQLRAAGFFTAAVVSSFPVDRRFGFDQGFELYSDEFDRGYVAEWAGEPVETDAFYALSKSVTDRALRILDDAPNTDQFLWLHYFDPHDPYGDSDGADGDDTVRISDLLASASRRSPGVVDQIAAAREAYDRDVETLDRSLARLFRHLDADAFETTVVFTSDHGESFGEEGTIGHGNRLTMEQIHVPLFIVSPGLQPGLREDTAGSVDVAATIRAVAGLDEVDDGRDLTSGSPATGATATGMRRAFDAAARQTLVDGRRIPKGGALFYVVEDGVLFTGDERRVFVADRRDEAVDGERATSLRARFSSLATELAATSSRTLEDERTRAALRALGYVD